LLANLIYIQGEETGSGTLHFLLLRGRCWACVTYIHFHRLIAFDNFFTSYQLLKRMNERGLCAVGTVRGSRTGLSDILQRKDGMQRGEFMFRTKGCVVTMKWQDNKPVTVPSKSLRWNGRTEMVHHRLFLALPQLQCINGRSRSLRPETREICNWEALTQMVAPSAVLSHWPCEQFYNVKLRQRDQLSFRHALIWQLTVAAR
jgi:hypothetical protein